MSNKYKYLLILFLLVLDTVTGQRQNHYESKFIFSDKKINLNSLSRVLSSPKLLQKTKTTIPKFIIDDNIPKNVKELYSCGYQYLVKNASFADAQNMYPILYFRLHMGNDSRAILSIKAYYEKSRYLNNVRKYAFMYTYKGIDGAIYLGGLVNHGILMSQFLSGTYKCLSKYSSDLYYNSLKYIDYSIVLENEKKEQIHIELKPSVGATLDFGDLAWGISKNFNGLEIGQIDSLTLDLNDVRSISGKLNQYAWVYNFFGLL